MLTCLRVRDLAIIEALEVEFGPGLNVVTGETGAGKSILVDALELVLGAKAKPELVRTGASHAEVEALFEVGDDPRLRARLAALEIETGEDELVIRRVVRPNGRSRAYLNGRLANASQLGELARGLADISSQHEHHGLVHPATHISYLDAFAGLLEQRAEVTRAYETLREARQALDAFETRVHERAQREDLLRFQVHEIEEIAPEAGELSRLGERRDRLRHAETLMQLLGRAEETLYGRDPSLCAELARVASDVTEAANLDGSLSELSEQLESTRTTLEEIARELGQKSREVEANPSALGEVEERLHALKRLQRKYGNRLEDVCAHAEDARRELAELADHEEHSEALRKAVEQAREQVTCLARQLSQKRKKAARKLGEAISKELASLGMGGARVVVDVAAMDSGEGETTTDGIRLTAQGLDRVEFLIAPNRGETARPLGKIASGGELSRAMLAIKRVLAGLGPAGMYVFDEVDSGVGGAVAEVIGRKIRDVAGHGQVLCITHLPQIAVFADTHFRVAKEERSGRTHSHIVRLTASEQKEEVARMLGGIKVTAKTRAAAGEMLRQART